MRQFSLSGNLFHTKLFAKICEYQSRLLNEEVWPARVPDVMNDSRPFLVEHRGNQPSDAFF